MSGLVGRQVGRTVLDVEGTSLQLANNELDVGFVFVGVCFCDHLRCPLVVYAWWGTRVSEL